MSNPNINRDWSQYASLEEMSEWAQERGFKSSRAYFLDPKSNKPKHFFFQPQFMPGFKEKGGWGWFLGTGRRRYKEPWATIEECAEYIREINAKDDTPIIRSMQGWTRYAKNPENKVPAKYPRRFDMHYKNEYQEKGPFKKLISLKQLWGYGEAQRYAQNLGFKSTREFMLWARSDDRPDMFPQSPQRAYSGKGFKSMHDFLGLEEPETKNASTLSKKDSKLNGGGSVSEYEESIVSDAISQRMIPAKAYLLLVKRAESTFLKEKGIESLDEFKSWLKSQ